MTYCFAWKYQNSVFLIADTLVTQGTPADLQVTNMNEPQCQLAPNEFVEERLLKIRELKEGVAVAISGDIRLAFEITDFMREHIDTVGEVADLFPMVEASFGPFDPILRVQILVVEAVDHGECTIGRWDSQVGYEIAPISSYIGSLPQRFADVIANLILRLQLDWPSKEAILYSGIALVESYGQCEDLVSQNVGGVVCGLRVQESRTIWMEDVITVLYKDDHTFDGMVSVHVRDGNLCINSTFRGVEGTILVNKSATAHSIAEMRAWGDRWLPFLRDYLSEHFMMCNRWLFINRDRLLSVVFLVHTTLDKVEHELRITRSANGDVNFEFRNELSDALWRAAAVYPMLRVMERMDPAVPRPDGLGRAG